MRGGDDVMRSDGRGGEAHPVALPLPARGGQGAGGGRGIVRRITGAEDHHSKGSQRCHHNARRCGDADGERGHAAGAHRGAERCGRKRAHESK